MHYVLEDNSTCVLFLNHHNLDIAPMMSLLHYWGFETKVALTFYWVGAILV